MSIFSNFRIALHSSVDSPTRELLIALVLSHGASFYPHPDSDSHGDIFPSSTPEAPTHVICSGATAGELLQLAGSIGPEPPGVAHFWLLSAAWVDKSLADGAPAPEQQFGARVPKTWVVPERSFQGLRLYFWPEDGDEQVETSDHDSNSSPTLAVNETSKMMREKMEKGATDLGATIVQDPSQCDKHVARCASQVPEAFRNSDNCNSLIWLKDSIIHGGPITVTLQPLVYRPAKGLHGIPELNEKTIAISGYRGNDRLYAVRMVLLTGAQYTPYLTDSTSYLVAKEPSGDKYQSATQWGVRVVTRQWLEDCVLNWTASPAENYQLSG